MALNSSSLAFAVLFAASFTFADGAVAQVYPDRAVHIIVPFAPGGSTDQLARLIGQNLTGPLKQPVIIENKPGAGGMLAHGQVAKATPDGYTLIITNQADAINSVLQSKMPYDLVKDFQPVTSLIVNAYMLVSSPSLGVSSLKDLSALGRRADRPKLSYASSGIGTGSHMAGELLKRALKVDMVHVPYKGTGPAAADVTAGHTSMMFLSGATALPLIRGGKLRAVGVSTAKRAPGAGEIPTLAELGLAKFDIGSWQGLQAPANTPRAVINKLVTEVHRIMERRDVRARLMAGGSEITLSTPEAFGAYIRADMVRWAEVVKSAGIKSE